MSSSDPAILRTCPECGARPFLVCREPSGQIALEMHTRRLLEASLTPDAADTQNWEPSGEELTHELLREIRDLLLIQIARQGRVPGKLSRQIVDARSRQEGRP